MRSMGSIRSQYLSVFGCALYGLFFANNSVLTMIDFLGLNGDGKVDGSNDSQTGPGERIIAIRSTIQNKNRVYE